VALTKHFNRRRTLRIADFLVAFLERVRFKALPGQRAPQEIHEHMTERFQVVPATLLLAKMCIDAHVAGSARQALVLPVRYVFVGFGVDVGLGKAEVNYVYDVLTTRGVAAD